MKRKLIYQNIDEALSMMNAEDRGRYFLCSCPECNHQEAFMYKNNMSFIQCNRENQCGERFILKYQEKVEENQYTNNYSEPEDNNVTLVQRQQLKRFTDLIDHVQKNFKSSTLDQGYRGLSRKTTESFIADFNSEDGVKFMFEYCPDLFKKQYGESRWMRQRNLVFPIKGENGQIDRILLRSSIQENLEPKEIQLIVNPSLEARDFFVDVPKYTNTIVISESILDGLSFREIDQDVGLLALTGATKYRGMCRYLEQHVDQYQDYIFLLALDNDVAGQKTQANIAMHLDELGLSYEWFQYPEHIKDPNEFLIDYRDDMKRVYERCVRKKSMQPQKAFDIEHER